MPEQTDEQEFCEHCGAKLRRYKHPLVPILVHALVKFAQAVHVKGLNSIHLKDDMDGTAQELTRYERSNWTKLRFHGLVAKVMEDGHQKRGHWLLTRRGALFLTGKEKIPDFVWVFRNRIVEHSERMVDVTTVLGSTPYVETIDDIEYEAVKPN
jgi:hypothetical protein